MKNRFEKIYLHDKFLYLLAIISFAALIGKLWIAMNEHVYIRAGYDAAWVMEQTQRIFTADMSFGGLTRPLQMYLSASLKLITGMSVTELLAIPMVLSATLGFFFSYLLTLFISKNRSIALIAATAFAASSAINQVNSIIYYSLTLQPLLLYGIFKYCCKESKVWTLLLLLFAGISAYSQLFMIFWAAITIYVAILLITAIVSKKKALARHLGSYFLISPLVFLLRFEITSLLSPEKERGFDQFTWYTLGLSRAATLEGAAYIITAVKIGLLMAPLFFILAYSYDKIPNLQKKINDNVWLKILAKFRLISQKKHSEVLNKILSRTAKYLGIIFILFIATDIVKLILSVSPTTPPVINNNFLHLILLDKTVQFFGEALSSTLLVPAAFLLSGLSTLAIKKSPFFSLHKEYIFVFILLILLLSGIIPAVSQSPISNYSGTRGIWANMIPIMLFFAVAQYTLFYEKPTILGKSALTIIMAFAIYISTNTLYGLSRYNFDLKEQNAFIDAMKKYEKNADSMRFFYFKPYPHQPEHPKNRDNYDLFGILEHQSKLYEEYGKYYVHSFFTSSMGFDEMDDINKKNLYFENPQKFIKKMQEFNIEYFIVNSKYDYDRLQKILKSIPAQLVYDNNYMYILKTAR